MAVDMTAVGVRVVAGEAGDHAAGDMPEEAAGRYAETAREIDGTFGLRHFQIRVTVPLPTVVELSGTVPATEGEPSLRVA